LASSNWCEKVQVASFGVYLFELSFATATRH
jgi:hypothetical protein